MPKKTPTEPETPLPPFPGNKKLSPADKLLSTSPEELASELDKEAESIKKKVEAYKNKLEKYSETLAKEKRAHSLTRLDEILAEKIPFRIGDRVRVIGGQEGQVGDTGVITDGYINVSVSDYYVKRDSDGKMLDKRKESIEKIVEKVE